jgi:hypothetical protein
MLRSVLTLAAVLASSAVALSAEGLRPLVGPKCQTVAGALRAKKETRVAILVSGPEKSLPNARSADIEKLLKEELAKHKIAVSVTARYQLAADFAEATRDPAGKLQPFELKLTLTDSTTGKAVQGFDVAVDDAFLLRRLSGELASPLAVPLRDLARKVAEQLESQPENKLAVASFHGPDGEAAGFGKMLLEELARQHNKKGKVVLDPAAALRLRASCEVVELDGGRAGIAVRIEIVDRLGKRIGVELTTTVALSGPKSEQSVDIDGLTALLSSASTNVTLPPDLTAAKRVARYLNRRKEPQAKVVDKAWVTPDAGSPFSVALRVKGALLPVEIKDGQAFAQLNKDDVYEVVVRSTLGRDTAFATSLDGLSMFASSENANYTHLILPKGQKEAVVAGWHRTNEKVDRFQVKPLADTPAARLIRTGPGIGTVTVLFAAAWEKAAAPPDDEVLFKNLTRSGERMATGRGPEARAKFKEVERHIGAVRAAVTIRYTRD